MIFRSNPVSAVSLSNPVEGEDPCRKIIVWYQPEGEEDIYGNVVDE